MSFVEEVLAVRRPSSVRSVPLPRRTQSFASPADRRDEVIYFLLPDRFSDGREASRPLLDVSNPAKSRPSGFGFDKWAESGGGQYQDGTIAGIISKLSYLAGLLDIVFNHTGNNWSYANGQDQPFCTPWLARDADRYLQVLGTNLSATLDVGEIRPALTAVAKGLVPPKSYFDIAAAWDDDPAPAGRHVVLGQRRPNHPRR